MKCKFLAVFFLTALSLLALSMAKAEKGDRIDTERENSQKITLVREIIDDHYDDIKNESVLLGVPIAEIVAIIAVESSNDPDSVSNKGATGLMQMLPDTEKEINKSKCDYEETACQIKNGTIFFRQLKTSSYVQYFAKNENLSEFQVAALAYNEGLKGSKKFKTRKEVLAHNHVKKCTNYLRIALGVLGNEY